MSSSANDLIGRHLCDSANHRVGRITAVYSYPADHDAPWGVAAVTRGWLVRSTHLVDLQGADLHQETVQVPHTRHTISNAPSYTPLIGDTLSDRHAVEIRDHYRGAGHPV
jgi:hypothetical protein